MDSADSGSCWIISSKVRICSCVPPRNLTLSMDLFLQAASGRCCRRRIGSPQVGRKTWQFTCGYVDFISGSQAAFRVQGFRAESIVSRTLSKRQRQIFFSSDDYRNLQLPLSSLFCLSLSPNLFRSPLAPAHINLQCRQVWHG